MKFTHTRPPLFAFVALLIAIAACGAPAPEPAAPAATEAPTTEPAAPVATEAPATEQPQPELTETSLSDSFDNNDNGWGLFEEDGYSIQIQGGQMLIKLKQADYYSYSMPQVKFSDVDMSFDVVIQEGAQANAWFGAMCRYIDDDNHYDFAIDGYGYYKLSKKVNGEWSTLVDWTESTSIKPGVGETNRIRVVCSGSSLELYANDQPVVTSQDASLTAGGFALQAGRYEEDDALVSVVFDNLDAKYP